MSEVIANRCEEVLDLANAKLSNAYYYGHLPVCIIDAVFSISVKYTAVKNVVDRFGRVAGLNCFREHGPGFPPVDSQMKVSEFLSWLQSKGSLEAWLDVVFTRHRTSSRNGILKLEAVQMFAEVLKKHGVETFQDFAGHEEIERIEKEIRMIPGQGSGISWSYFNMLAGSDNHIKPDRMVVRFLQDTVEHNVGRDEALSMLQGAISILRESHENLTLRLLDHTIWNYQRAI
jgi:hypothetical protein